MNNYLTPGVYIEDLKNASPSSESGSLVAGFIGITQRGKVGVPVSVTSWNSFITNFSMGMDTPFIPNSDLAYAVYGFFQNGGKRCYIVRTAHSTAKVAACSLSGSEILINAKDEGTWGNSLKLDIEANASVAANFDIKVSLGTSIVEVIRNVSNTKGDRYWVDAVNDTSKYISGVSGTLTATEESATFSGGADGVSDIADADFTESLGMFDSVDDVNLISIPGQASEAVHTGISDYVNKRGDVFAVLDCLENATVDSVIEARKLIDCEAGELLFPWIKVVDPLSSTGKTRLCPPSGHVCGIISRIASSRGIWKTPAGTEAVVRGAVETATYISNADTDKLNPASVVPILPKANAGIVVWGGRSLSSDESMKYVSDVLLGINIKKTVYNNTQQYVFEPNNENTWNKVKATVESYLDLLWRSGGLKGSSASEAYFVKCDADLNTPEVISQGIMIAQVGYASHKPAEFLVFQFSHDLSN